MSPKKTKIKYASLVLKLSSFLRKNMGTVEMLV